MKLKRKIFTVIFGTDTPAGKAFDVAMLTGHSIIAVPTGIISVELGKAVREGRRKGKKACPACGHQPHDDDARFCKICGSPLY
ncbi:MAG TPA: hypothetical protein ENO05_10615 [Bacteroides sp.]|nr:hypothetical protein [Bacteroides sp.]